jgi:hypothetical protein
MYFDGAAPAANLDYCWGDLICASTPGTDSDPEDREYRGVCVSEEYCRDAPAAGIDVTCIYSDETTFVTGPPDEPVCPPAPDPRTPFCGGPCGSDGCPFSEPRLLPLNGVSCVGLSDTRGLGICALHTRGQSCAPGVTSLMTGCHDPGVYGTPCLCLVLRRGDELETHGWITLESSCRAYRDRYPADFTCLDEHGNEVP